MRAMWTGAISFGLVNIPVRLYSAVGETKLDLDMLSAKDLAPIKYVRVSSADGKEVDFKDIVKGYEIEKGQYVVLDDKDFEKVNVKKTKTIEIVEFVNEDEIDPIYFEKPYYLEPDKNAAKPYALLREALRLSKKVGIARYVLRNREHIGVIKTSGNVILLDQMRYHADIRDANELNLPDKKMAEKKEIDMAMKLIDQLTGPFTPENFKDEYIEELRQIIEAKAEGKLIVSKEEAPEPTHVKDLMETLKASLNAVKDKPVAKNRTPVSGAAKGRKKPAGKKKKKEA